MNHTVRLSILLILLCLQACSTKTGSEQTSTSASTTLIGETPGVPAGSGAALSSRLRDLGMRTDSDWRGITIGDPLTKVREKEKATLFENKPDHLGYSIDFANLESVDMLYRYDAKQTVTGIDVDIYLNDAQSVDAYVTDLKRYFDTRYKASGTAGTWQGENSRTITLKNVSKGKDYGLKLSIR